MKKRIYILAGLLVPVIAGIVVCSVFLYRSTPELKGSDLEQMRDTLKVYQTVPADPKTKRLDDTTEPDIIPNQDVPETEPQEEIIFEIVEYVPETPVEVHIPETEAETEIMPETEPMTEETKPPETVPEETETPKPPEPTLDFDSMQKVNPDIYAWIEIEGTKVDYPILQSPTEDNKYLTTAHDGSYYVGGSIFTQASYNAKDFNDPVTVIYGHTMRSGTLFGQLQPVYSSASGFAEHSEMVIYLPNEVRRYTVFAAVPYKNWHILHTYDFSEEYWYKSFFDSIGKIRSIGANFNREIIPEYGDRVIILSTCLNEDSTKRYLVMAIHQDDLADHVNP
ncbi:MAG: sortase [Clostridia bacterium]|nr:sortase [Clostridia bacterium]